VRGGEAEIRRAHAYCTRGDGPGRRVLFHSSMPAGGKGIIDSFNARLRNQCLKVGWFVSLADRAPAAFDPQLDARQQMRCPVWAHFEEGPATGPERGGMEARPV